MNVSDVVAFYAAIVSTGALVLEVRRWFESRAKIHVSATPGMSLLANGRFSDEEYILVNATNRGLAPTTITHFGFEAYPDLGARLRRRPSQSMWVPMASQGSGQQLPFGLAPGAYWTGMAEEDEAISGLVEKGHLWAVIYATHREKPTRIKVPKKLTRPKAKTDEHR